GARTVEVGGRARERDAGPGRAERGRRGGRR
ncbi:MAG: hypothetical protein AVDCRST_MAG11-3900, partial [uncultured Gemmatimonadaceae bacterium]